MQRNCELNNKVSNFACRIYIKIPSIFSDKTKILQLRRSANRTHQIEQFLTGWERWERNVEKKRTRVGRWRGVWSQTTKRGWKGKKGWGGRVDGSKDSNKWPRDDFPRRQRTERRNRGQRGEQMRDLWTALHGPEVKIHRGIRAKFVTTEKGAARSGKKRVRKSRDFAPRWALFSTLPALTFNEHGQILGLTTFAASWVKV